MGKYDLLNLGDLSFSFQQKSSAPWESVVDMGSAQIWRTAIYVSATQAILAQTVKVSPYLLLEKDIYVSVIQAISAQTVKVSPH